MATSRELIFSIGWSGRFGFHGGDLTSLSLARYEHINRLGKYTFPSQVEVELNKLRPLRKPLKTV